MLSVEDCAEIRRLHRTEGLPIKAVARVLGISKNTVKAALASDQPPKYERRQAGSIVDEVEPRIRELLQSYPNMPATVIAERIGWTRSIRVLSARVAELRPVYLPPDPASRTAYAAVRSPSAICGSRRCTFRQPMGRRVNRRCCR
jgi:transposase